MRILSIIAAVAVSSFAVLACGASPEASEANAQTSEAVQSAAATGGLNAACGTDSSCRVGLVCDLHCPLIPNKPHCNIAGGTCQPVCELFSSDLTGKTFTSSDGVHSITFTSSTQFSKTDGCTPLPNGAHCQHIVLTTGSYTSYGTSIALHAANGTRDTLAVDTHCYDGLLDEASNVNLYPVAN
jgi:hypothetical protein